MAQDLNDDFFDWPDSWNDECTVIAGSGSTSNEIIRDSDSMETGRTLIADSDSMKSSTNYDSNSMKRAVSTNYDSDSMKTMNRTIVDSDPKNKSTTYHVYGPVKKSTESKRIWGGRAQVTSW